MEASRSGATSAAAELRWAAMLLDRPVSALPLKPFTRHVLEHAQKLTLRDLLGSSGSEIRGLEFFTDAEWRDLCDALVALGHQCSALQPHIDRFLSATEEATDPFPVSSDELLAMAEDLESGADWDRFLSLAQIALGPQFFATRVDDVLASNLRQVLETIPGLAVAAGRLASLCKNVGGALELHWLPQLLQSLPPMTQEELRSVVRLMLVLNPQMCLTEADVLHARIPVDSLRPTYGRAPDAGGNTRRAELDLVAELAAVERVLTLEAGRPIHITELVMRTHLGREIVIQALELGRLEGSFLDSDWFLWTGTKPHTVSREEGKELRRCAREYFSDGSLLLRCDRPAWRRRLRPFTPVQVDVALAVAPDLVRVGPGAYIHMRRVQILIFRGFWRVQARYFPSM